VYRASSTAGNLRLPQSHKAYWTASLRRDSCSLAVLGCQAEHRPLVPSSRSFHGGWCRGLFKQASGIM